ncbi:J domain-containing protein [Planctomycetota bacterium]|jgi:hypothetical protein|nr:J domain-containing protein [Planctomycetota bacterium]
MRDLYALLGLEPTAALDDIRLALDRTPDPELRADGQAILLDPAIKRDYDQILGTVQHVGELRARLFTQQWPKPQIADAWSNGPMEAHHPRAQRASRLRRETLSDLEMSKTQPGATKTPQPPRDRPTEGRKAPPQRPEKSSSPTPSGSGSSSAKGGKDLSGLFGCLLFWGALALIAHCSKDESAPSAPSRSRSTQPVRQAAAFDQPAKRLPATGIWYDEPAGFASGPLKVTTGPSTTHYFLKVLNVNSGRTVASGFVRANGSLEFNLALGEYTVRYAAGTTWYGSEHRFGPATSYAQTDRTFNIGSGRGYTIELFSRPYGNLGTDRIGAEDF